MEKSCNLPTFSVLFILDKNLFVQSFWQISGLRSWSSEEPDLGPIQDHKKPNQYIPMALSPTKSLFFFKSKNSSPSEATLCNLSNPEKVHPKFEEEGQLKSQ